MNIPPKSEKSFALLMKYKGEGECYAFNGENYIKGLENDLSPKPQIEYR
jgi:hypothetical protein